MYEIVFDGGSLGNPGLGYGSYEVTSGGDVLQRVERQEYGQGVTNNQAEYRSLIGALAWLRQHLGDNASGATVVVNGDSQLVLNQVRGTWKVKNEGLRPFHSQARELANQFGNVTFTWHDRSNSVRRLGH
ncbi:MAG TPA: ribonuclease HI family protein [Thermomicrobiales bacterium]|nr:ribonuclease HI family protein [Thermomicrobiales bacterium]